MLGSSIQTTSALAGMDVTADSVLIINPLSPATFFFFYTVAVSTRGGV